MFTHFMFRITALFTSLFWISRLEIWLEMVEGEEEEGFHNMNSLSLSTTSFTSSSSLSKLSSFSIFLSLFLCQRKKKKRIVSGSIFTLFLPQLLLHPSSKCQVMLNRTQVLMHFLCLRAQVWVSYYEMNQNHFLYMRGIENYEQRNWLFTLWQ